MANYSKKAKDTHGHFVDKADAGKECWHQIRRRFTSMGFSFTQEAESDDIVVRDPSGGVVGRFPDYEAADAAMEARLKENQMQNSAMAAKVRNEEERELDKVKKRSQKARVTRQSIIDAGGEIEDETTGRKLMINKSSSPYIKGEGYLNQYVVSDRDGSLSIFYTLAEALKYFRREIK